MIKARKLQNNRTLTTDGNVASGNLRMMTYKSENLTFAFSSVFAILIGMKIVSEILPIIQIVLAVILIVGVLLQQSEAGLSGAFGGSDNFSSHLHTRRGFEKFLFIGTIVIGVLFVISAVLSLLI